MAKELIITIGDRYRLNRKIAAGGFGAVYLGTDLQSSKQVAIKLEHTRRGSGKLKLEAEAYRTLAGGAGVPRVLLFDEECDYYVLVFNYCGRRFSLKTVLLVADQLLTRIEYIHSKSLVHRDVKPDNFLVGTGGQGNTVYAIDFGLAEDYRTVHSRGRHEGTCRYASISFHNGEEQYRRDDLESLGYVLVYFLRGSLPWQGLKASRGESRTKLVKEMKIKMLAGELCEGLPAEFQTYVDYTRSLSADAQPDYAYLQGLFRGLCERHGLAYDNVFDWTVKKCLEEYGELDERLPRASNKRR